MIITIWTLLSAEREGLERAREEGESRTVKKVWRVENRGEKV